MAYSKAKLKSSGDRASPHLRPLLIRNLSDIFEPTRTLLYVQSDSSLLALKFLRDNELNENLA